MAGQNSALVIVIGMRLPVFPGREDTSSHFGSRELVEQGRQIFEFTPIYASSYARANLSCSSCHAEGGLQPTAAPMTGVEARFPHLSSRAGRVISLRDRVRECFIRSENGSPPDDKSETMHAMLAYLHSISKRPAVEPVTTGGLPILPILRGDANAGQQLYISHCVGCHGDHGEGLAPQWPPLWGQESFNNGAGMDQVPKLASFIRYNMPQNNRGSLSSQQAYDLAAYITEQPRPQLDQQLATF